MLRHYITAGSDGFSLNKKKQSFLYLYAAFLPDLPIVYHLYMPPLFFFFFDDDQTFWHYCEKSNQTFKFVLRDLVMP